MHESVPLDLPSRLQPSASISPYVLSCAAYRAPCLPLYPLYLSFTGLLRGFDATRSLDQPLTMHLGIVRTVTIYPRDFERLLSWE